MERFSHVHKQGRHQFDGRFEKSTPSSRDSKYDILVRKYLYTKIISLPLPVLHQCKFSLINFAHIIALIIMGHIHGITFYRSRLRLSQPLGLFFYVFFCVAFFIQLIAYIFIDYFLRQVDDSLPCMTQPGMLKDLVVNTEPSVGGQVPAIVPLHSLYFVHFVLSTSSAFILFFCTTENIYSISFTQIISFFSLMKKYDQFCPSLSLSAGN